MQEIMIEAYKTGDMVKSNLAGFIPALRELAQQQNAVELKTDEDISKQKDFVKSIKGARQRLKNKVLEIESGFSSLFEFKQQASEADSLLCGIQSHGERLLKSARELRKREIISQAEKELRQELERIEKEIGYRIKVEYDLESPTQRKKTIASMEKAVQEAKMQAIFEAKRQGNQAKENLDFLKQQADGFMFLFNDMANLVFLPTDTFRSTVISRVEQHKAVEKAKAEAEAQRIKAEAARKEAEMKAELEKEKARMKAELEKAKIQVETNQSEATEKVEENNQDEFPEYENEVASFEPKQVSPVQVAVTQPGQKKQGMPEDLKYDLAVFARKAGLTSDQYEELLTLVEIYF